MNDKLITQLSNLILEKNFLKRKLDINYFNKQKRQEIFAEIQETEEKIKKIKFKIELERRIKNEKFRKDI